MPFTVAPAASVTVPALPLLAPKMATLPLTQLAGVEPFEPRH